MQDGQFFPLKHGSILSFEKPPLKLWLSSIAPWIFGENNWSYRAFDGLLGVVAVLLSTILTFRLSRSVPCALTVGFLLLGVPEWTIAHHGFRRAVLDGLLTVLTLAMAMVTWRLIDERDSSTRSFRWLGILTAVAFLTKSVAGVVPAVCALASVSVCRPDSLKLKNLLVVASIPALASTCFIIAVYFVGGSKGIATFLGVEIVTRALSGFEGHNADKPLYYFWYLFSRAAVAPQLALILGTIGSLAATRASKSHRFILVWAYLPLCAYSCSSSKAPWYLNPFMPFVIMTAILGSVWMASFVKERTRAGAVFASVVAALIFSICVPYQKALSRVLLEVSTDNWRIPLDTLVSTLPDSHSKFIIVDNALSGRSSPINGRFNLEGIYRGMLSKSLAHVQGPEEIRKEPLTAIFIREDAVSALPAGWREIDRLPPFGPRRDWLLVVDYPPI